MLPPPTGEAGSESGPGAQPAQFGLCPILSTVGCLLAMLMIAYPTYVVYWLGEAHHEGASCGTYLGLWRTIHVSHLMLWTYLLGLILSLFPRRLEKDPAGTEYRYVTLALTIPVPLSLINEVKRCRWLPGYVQVSTAVLPLVFRPTVGAEAFIEQHEAAGAPSAAYGATAASSAGLHRD